MITFESFISPEGIVVAAGLVNRLVSILKTVSPKLDASVSGAFLSFVLSAVLYILTALAINPGDPNGYLTVFAAWLAVAGGAVGIDSTIRHIDRQQLKTVSNDPVDLTEEL